MKKLRSLLPGLLIAGMFLLLVPLAWTDGNLVHETMMKKVVLIYEPGVMIGSGVVVSPDGYIVTNRHVAGYSIKRLPEPDEYGHPRYELLGEPRPLLVYNSDWGYASARTVAVSRDPNRDLAVLKIETIEELPYAEVAQVGNMFPGDTVYVVGHPLGVGWSMTKGIVSKFITTTDHNKFILHDASINQGNSGGPLFDEFGRVVGLNFAAIPPFQAENMAIAIDARVVFRFVDMAVHFDRKRLEVMSEDSFQPVVPPKYYYEGHWYQAK